MIRCRTYMLAIRAPLRVTIASGRSSATLEGERLKVPPERLAKHSRFYVPKARFAKSLTSLGFVLNPRALTGRTRIRLSKRARYCVNLIALSRLQYFRSWRV
jgi:hypothetical protein